MGAVWNDKYSELPIDTDQFQMLLHLTLQYIFDSLALRPRNKYHISANSCQDSYSFLNLQIEDNFK